MATATATSEVEQQVQDNASTEQNSNAQVTAEPEDKNDKKEEDEDADADEEEDEPQSDRASQFIQRLRQMVSFLTQTGQLEVVAKILQDYFEFYATREYITPAIDLPKFANRFVAADGDIAYCWSLSFDLGFFARLCFEGFLSICSFPQKLVPVLMPWIDPERAVMEFGAMHVSKVLVKRSKHYRMTVNADLDGVVAGCVKQHGESWLWPPMQELLRNGFRSPDELISSFGAAAPAGLKQSGFRVVTFELWDKRTNKLVAGDLGYVVGRCYTSMSGFRSPDTKGCGTIQLVGTYALLKRCGFAWWDLGMVMDYKKELGAKVVQRKQFISDFHQIRNTRCNLTVESTATNSMAAVATGGLTKGVELANGATNAPTIEAQLLIREARSMERQKLATAKPEAPAKAVVPAETTAPAKTKK